jgi:diguanylate cyclase (GGDEF)-like protein/hemerythrin-like metal-binding protein
MTNDFLIQAERRQEDTQENSLVFDKEFGQELCDLFTEVLGFTCIFVEKGGKIVASSIRERIGTIHAGARRIMAGEVSEYAVSPEEAESSGGLMREGLSVGIDFGGARLISFGIAGPLEAVTPLARIVGFCVTSILRARQVERQISIQHAQSAISDSQRLLEEMRVQASTDSLTGAWNRLRLEAAAKNEILRLGRYRHPVSMIFADLDHFKEINDKFGHGIGDKVLRGFCDVVRRTMRVLDVLGRWGGEEFVIILPNTGQDTAYILARRICELLRQQDFLPVPKVTVSFGVTECGPGESFESWFSRADRAMYQAKKNGRNQVIVGAKPQGAATVSERFGGNLVLLVWDDRYQSGEPNIDIQHKKLFQKANSLLAATMNSVPVDDVLGLVDDLLQDVKEHFRYEESIIVETDFPGIEKHLSLHKALLERSEKLKMKAMEGDLALGNLFTFLAYDLVASHILGEDRKFFPYLRQGNSYSV